MTNPGFQRARQPEQKARRIADILSATREMLAESGIDDLTLNGLARRVGLAKSGIYRYFESREAILLHVFQEDICEWVDELVERVGRLRGKSRVEKLAGLLASVTARRHRLCMFASVVSGVLEHNVSVETARAFKLANMKAVHRLVGVMAEEVPELTAEQHGEILQLFGGLVAGFWPSANPPEVMLEVLKDPQLSGFKHDFQSRLERGALLFARGLLAEQTESRK